LSVVGFSGGNIFYDSLLVAVSKEKERNRASALGFSLGYLGGGILFLINVIMFLYPIQFGLENQIEAVLWSFVSVAVWWLIFSLPLYLNVKEPIQNPNNHRTASNTFVFDGVLI
jgi:UMF1 family MFS transporter